MTRIDIGGAAFDVVRLRGGYGGLFARVGELGGTPGLADVFRIRADMVWFRDSSRYSAETVNRILDAVS